MSDLSRHQQQAEIDRAFVNWTSAASITQIYGFRDRSTVYRHAHAFDLFEKRKANVRAALESIIEKAGDVEVTASGSFANPRKLCPLLILVSRLFAITWIPCWFWRKPPALDSLTACAYELYICNE